MTSTHGLRWSVERRLQFIRERLAWEGSIRREDIVQQFGVSANQATADLNRFAAMYPGALQYDLRLKAYRAGPSFPPLSVSDASGLLNDLRLIAESVVPSDSAVLRQLPAVEVASSPSRPVRPEILIKVLHAVREKKVLAAIYQSLSEPRPARKVLEPHALVFDGFRWHARAKDIGAGEFRDFVLGRLTRATIGQAAVSTPADDRDWLTATELTIAPHPGLSASQAKVIAADYGMRRGKLVLTCRSCNAFYVKRRLGLLSGHLARPAQEQHIVLKAERRI